MNNQCFKPFKVVFCGALVVVFLFFIDGIFAQQLPVYSSYMFNGLAYNPGYTGSHKDGIVVQGLYRRQFSNISSGPSTQILTGHSRILGSNSSVGGIVFNDHLGVSNQFGFFATYAYHVPISRFNFGREVYLGLGLQAGGFQYTTAYSELDAFANPDSPIDKDADIPTDARSSFNFNGGAGLYLYSKLWFLGLSAPLFIRNNLAEVNGVAEKLERHLFLSGGLVFMVTRAFRLRPTTYIKLVSGAPVQYDASLMGIFLDRYWLGFSYKSSGALGLISQVSITNKIRVGYSFDLNRSSLRSALGNGHEITLSFLLGKRNLLLDNPRYF